MLVDLQYFGGRGARSSRKGAGSGSPKKVSLPELEGSEKQVSWAKDIRERTVNKLHDYESGKVTEGKKDAWETHLRFIAHEGHQYLDLPRRRDFRSTETFKSFIDRHRQSSLIYVDHADQKARIKSYYDNLSKSVMPKVKKVQGSETKIPGEKMTALYNSFLTDRVRKQLKNQSSASWWIKRR